MFFFSLYPYVICQVTESCFRSKLILKTVKFTENNKKKLFLILTIADFIANNIELVVFSRFFLEKETIFFQCVQITEMQSNGS